MDKNILAALDVAGEALKALGEESVVASFHAAGGYFTGDRYGVTLTLAGLVGGVHGSGSSLSEAFQVALNRREIEAIRLRVEAQVRAEVEQRMQRQEAA
jgi:hypothetical protein